jgi:hypothetical protein
VLCGLAVLACLHQRVQAQPQAILDDLDRGHRLLLQNGFQLHGLAFLGNRVTHPYPTDPVNLSVLEAANFNGIHFGSANWTDVMWTPPNVGDYKWSRWSSSPNAAPYTPYDATGLVMASGQDELNLADSAVRTQYANYLSQMRTLMPNVISHTTQAGGVPTFSDLQTYAAQAQPDMLYFDEYVFDNAGQWAGGSPTRLYTVMGKYRAAARAGNDGTYTKPIPVGQWAQTYKRGGYTLSQSEMSLYWGASWAYGYKSINAFTYGTMDVNDDVASVFFAGANGTNPTAHYYRAGELNRQTLNLAPALLRLKSENVLFVLGDHKGGFLNVQTIQNTLPQYASQWQDSDDPYMTNINVTNVSHPNGTMKNDGLDGDVIVGYFKPLHEGFDGPNFSEQLYFMITNGLTSSTGDQYDTRQLVRLDFDFVSSGINSLLRLDRDTGQVVETALIHDGGSLYHLDWFLLGGEGDLFKYNTGAAFVIPEPATAVMMSLFGLALLRRRRA